jgi:biopolymer transport protein ExbD
VKPNHRASRLRGALGASSLTPLLDTLFLLLFALLAASRRASTETVDPRSEEVRVELPTVDALQQAARGHQSDVRLVVHVDALGAVTLIAGAEPVETPTAAELRAALAAETANASGRVVVEIRADADARHGVTVDVLQTVRAAGIVDVRFVATSGPEASEVRRFGDAPGGAR